MRVVLAGAIAVGKTTAADALERNLSGATVIREPVEELHFLPRFYADPTRWSFHSRLELLAHKAKLWARPADDGIVVYDRGMHELITFARVLTERGEMDGDELDVYERVYEVLVATLPAPDVIVWCRCDTDECLRRVAGRARPYEQGITPDYIDALDAEYRRWTKRRDLPPTLVYDTTDGAPAALNEMIGGVRRHVGR